MDSFGGGFELMREGDRNGIWKMMEVGVKYSISFATYIATSELMLRTT